MPYIRKYSELQPIIYNYCLGSPLYKEINKSTFIKTIKEMDDNDIKMVADYYQMGGILHDILILIPEISHKVLAFKNIYSYQKLKASSIESLIYEITSINDFKKIDAVLLKGTSVWDVEYDPISQRRVTDLDLLLHKKSDFYSFVDIIEKMGFTSEIKNWEKFLSDDEEYELPPFKRTVLIKEFSDELNFDVHPSKYKDIVKGEEKNVIHQEIEIHKHLFLFKDNSFPVINYEKTRKCSKYLGFKKLSTAQQIIYHSVKFEIDKTLYSTKMRYGAKFYKLLGDVIILILNSTQEDINDCIEIANEWNVLDEFRAVIERITPLVPEIEIEI